MESIWFYLLYFVLFLILAIKLKKQPRKKFNLPPSPPSFPIIGHLHLLRRPPLHRTFNNLAEKYGPVISIRLGSRLAVIVSSSAAAEECLTKNDIVLANRPPFANGRYLQYNCTTLAAASYGDHWRHLRKLCTIEIFSTTRLNSFRDIRKDEVKNLLTKVLHDSRNGSGKVVLRPMFLDMNFNNVLRMITGKKYDGEDAKENAEEARMFREMMQEFSELTTVTNLGDLFPILEWADVRIVKKMSRVGKKMDAFFQRLVDAHRADNKDRNAMIDHLLALQREEPEYYTDEIIKGLILCFEVERIGEEEIEMKEKAMTLMQRANPLEVKCKARPCLSKFLS
ncbi:hypothetical protein Tsubulata_009749 [Turnera subulata]|uniref:Cytochrome P450 n=1 Tax=Turnera subulata TaxID=218843 RepID=A0A9Q0J0H0_9ROSI|nr:hypothetical protein Tsubulata_009749 [Turnera subulata]